MPIYIDADTCIACGACVGTCPRGALSLAGDPLVAIIAEELCIACGACVVVCPVDALSLLGADAEGDSPPAPRSPEPTPSPRPPRSVSPEVEEPGWSPRTWNPGRGKFRAAVRRRLRRRGGRRP